MCRVVDLEQITNILYKPSYSLVEYDTVVPQIEKLTKGQIKHISKEFWDLSSTNLRMRIVENYGIYLRGIGYYEKVEFVDGELEKISKLDYDKLVNHWSGNNDGLPPKDLKESIHYWLRIGDYKLGFDHTGHRSWLKNNNLSIDSDRYR